MGCYIFQNPPECPCIQWAFIHNCYWMSPIDLSDKAHVTTSLVGELIAKNR